MFPGYNIVKHAFPGISDAKLAKNRLYVKEKTDLIENVESTSKCKISERVL